MRALALVVVLAVARVASAGHSIIVMSEPAQQGALGSAMQVALAGRGVAIATVSAPAGELRLERAADAQRAALQLGADAAVWIDEADVCAVSADGRAFRHAPMPPGVDNTPRAFSAIATSLLDELIAPPEPAVDVDVHVHVDPFDGPPRVSVIAPPRGYGTPPPARELGAHSGQVVISIGPEVTPVSAGLQLAAAFPVSERYHFTLGGSYGKLTFDSAHDGTVLGFAELRHEGAGVSHFDYGFVGGGGSVEIDSHDGAIVYLGMRLAHAWELGTTAVAASLTPIVAYHEKVGPGIFPGVYGALTWELPL